jgi:hypothetical protein
MLISFGMWVFSREEKGGNTLRILVATDCHLGYLEKDEVRRFDSFDTFEEICSLAEKNKVHSLCVHHLFCDALHVVIYERLQCFSESKLLNTLQWVLVTYLHIYSPIVLLAIYIRL